MECERQDARSYLVTYRRFLEEREAQERSARQVSIRLGVASGLDQLVRGTLEDPKLTGWSSEVIGVVAGVVQAMRDNDCERGRRLLSRLRQVGGVSAANLDKVQIWLDAAEP